MTSRRAVNRLHDELSSAEAYGALLFAVAQNDWKTASEVRRARPSYDVVVQRSDVTNWNEGFIALAREFDRELRISLAASEAADVVHQFAQLSAELLARIAPQMYLSGVAAASGDTDSQEHQGKAKDISNAVLDGMQPEVEEWSEAEFARRQRAADLVYGFDGVCQAAGIDPDVVARVLLPAGVEVLDDLRQISPSEEAKAWFLCLAEILLDHVSDEALPELAGLEACR